MTNSGENTPNTEPTQEDLTARLKDKALKLRAQAKPLAQHLTIGKVLNTDAPGVHDAGESLWICRTLDEQDDETGTEETSHIVRSIAIRDFADENEPPVNASIEFCERYKGAVGSSSYLILRVMPDGTISQDTYTMPNYGENAFLRSPIELLAERKQLAENVLKSCGAFVDSSIEAQASGVQLPISQELGRAATSQPLDLSMDLTSFRTDEV